MNSIGIPDYYLTMISMFCSLTGIVKHNGGLHGGHYIAYVKVRPNTKTGEKFLQPLPLKMGLDDLIREMHRRCENQDAASDAASHNTSQGYASDEANDGAAASEAAAAATAAEDEVSIPDGRWYLISDSSVRSVPESAVLNAEAYLLFYERLT